jgi:hypothetical protein
MRLMKTAAILFLLAIVILFAEQPPKHDIQGPMPAKDGETCVVCYGRCDSNDVAYMVDGQRFAVMKPLEKEFLQDPDKYIRMYKPNSIQFTGDTVRMSNGFLLAGLLLLLSLLIAGFATHQLVLKRSAGAPVPAGLAKIPATSAPARCPACGGDNHPSARRCSHCGSALTPSVSSEVERT